MSNSFSRLLPLPFFQKNIYIDPSSQRCLNLKNRLFEIYKTFVSDLNINTDFCIIDSLFSPSLSHPNMSLLPSIVPLEEKARQLCIPIYPYNIVSQSLSSFYPLKSKVNDKNKRKENTIEKDNDLITVSISIFNNSYLPRSKTFSRSGKNSSYPPYPTLNPSLSHDSNSTVFTRPPSNYKRHPHKYSCELCHSSFINLSNHRSSISHQKAVKDLDNWKQLDRAIQEFDEENKIKKKREYLTNYNTSQPRLSSHQLTHCSINGKDNSNEDYSNHFLENNKIENKNCEINTKEHSNVIKKENELKIENENIESQPTHKQDNNTTELNTFIDSSLSSPFPSISFSLSTPSINPIKKDKENEKDINTVDETKQPLIEEEKLNKKIISRKKSKNQKSNHNKKFHKKSIKKMKTKTNEDEDDKEDIEEVFSNLESISKIENEKSIQISSEISDSLSISQNHNTNNNLLVLKYNQKEININKNQQNNLENNNLYKNKHFSFPLHSIPFNCFLNQDFDEIFNHFKSNKIDQDLSNIANSLSDDQNPQNINQKEISNENETIIENENHQQKETVFHEDDDFFDNVKTINPIKKDKENEKDINTVDETKQPLIEEEKLNKKIISRKKSKNQKSNHNKKFHKKSIKKMKTKTNEDEDDKEDIEEVFSNLESISKIENENSESHTTHNQDNITPSCCPSLSFSLSSPPIQLSSDTSDSLSISQNHSNQKEMNIDHENNECSIFLNDHYDNNQNIKNEHFSFPLHSIPLHCFLNQDFDEIINLFKSNKIDQDLSNIVELVHSLSSQDHDTLMNHSTKIPPLISRNRKRIIRNNVSLLNSEIFQFKEENKPSKPISLHQHRKKLKKTT